jgi:glycosyltransferase involved in cell wall biosynthesis
MSRICFLADGLNSHTQKWVRYFAGRGWDVHLITFQAEPIPDVVVHPIRRIVPLVIEPSAPAFSKIGYLGYPAAVRKQVRRLSPDILHAHWATSYGLLGACTGVHPFVLSTWGSDVLDFPGLSWAHKKLLAWIIRRADVVTATSRMLTEKTRKFMRPGAPLHTIPFGVNMNVFRPAEPARIRSKGKVIVGVFKRLEPKYGIDVLIRALARSGNSRIELWLVGDGSQRMELESLSRALGVEKQIRFHGSVRHSRVPGMMGQVDMVAVPSMLSSETFGVVAVEASACALPVLASRIGGLPEVIVDGETGFLLPPGDEQAWAEGLNRLAKNPALRKKMGEEGKKFVRKHYIWEKNAEMMEALYNRLLR